MVFRWFLSRVLSYLQTGELLCSLSPLPLLPLAEVGGGEKGFGPLPSHGSLRFGGWGNLSLPSPSPGQSQEEGRAHFAVLRSRVGAEGLCILFAPNLFGARIQIPAPATRTWEKAGSAGLAGWGGGEWGPEIQGLVLLLEAPVPGSGCFFSCLNWVLPCPPSQSY